MSALALPSAGPAPEAAPAPEAVRIEDVVKRYGPRGNRVLALEHVSLSVGAGEFVCLLGASGCGKTTLLNLIAGLDRPAAGRISVNQGRPAMLFQEAALFPWLTAADNIELPLRLAHVKCDQRRQEIAGLLDLVHLRGFGGKRPHELSGGMRQRVALARALAQRAQLLLMDEPFAALDAMTRDILHEELERLWRERELTIVFVTHDVREAVRLADRIVLMTSRPGRVAAEFEVDLPRPRQIGSGEVASLAATVLEHLREEVRRHASR